MRPKQASSLFLALVLMLLGVRNVHAKDLVKVTIAGPGLNGRIELTDEAALNAFGSLEVEDQVEKPASAGSAHYFEVRVALGTGANIEAVYIYHYFPGTRAHPGYVYYPDVIDVMSDREGHYFRLSAGTDSVLRDYLANLGASLANSAGQPKTSRGFSLAPLWVLVGALLCSILAMTVRKRPSFFLRRLS